jgi:hypothetical protein
MFFVRFRQVAAEAERDAVVFHKQFEAGVVGQFRELPHKKHTDPLLKQGNTTPPTMRRGEPLTAA